MFKKKDAQTSRVMFVVEFVGWWWLREVRSNGMFFAHVQIAFSYRRQYVISSRRL